MPTYGGGGHAPEHSDATKAWHHLMRSTFGKLPRELQKSHEYRMKLRRLPRRH